jgi:hypothetical protein
MFRAGFSSLAEINVDNETGGSGALCCAVVLNWQDGGVSCVCSPLFRFRSSTLILDFCVCDPERGTPLADSLITFWPGKISELME